MLEIEPGPLEGQPVPEASPQTLSLFFILCHFLFQESKFHLVSSFPSELGGPVLAVASGHSRLKVAQAKAFCLRPLRKADLGARLAFHTVHLQTSLVPFALLLNDLIGQVSLVPIRVI